MTRQLELELVLAVKVEGRQKERRAAGSKSERASGRGAKAVYRISGERTSFRLALAASGATTWSAGFEERAGRGQQWLGWALLLLLYCGRTDTHEDDGEQRASSGRDDTAGVCCEATGGRRRARRAQGAAGVGDLGQGRNATHESDGLACLPVPIAWEKAWSDERAAEAIAHQGKLQPAELAKPSAGARTITPTPSPDAVEEGWVRSARLRTEVDTPSRQCSACS